MSLSIGELVGTISLNDQFSGPIDKVAKAIGISSESFKAITGFAVGAGAAIASATAAVVALGINGGKVVMMEQAFDALTGSVGETADAMLGSLSGATQGLISDMDLMAAANKAILLGLPVTSASMGTMAEAATVLGRAMGQDATKSLDDLTTALGRSSPMILDNLGLSVKVGDANETYARSLGKTAEQLTEAEKKTAFYNAAMAAAKAKVAELGGVHLTFADRVQQGRVMVTNFVDSLSKAVATSPVVAAGLDSIMKSMQAAFGGTQQDTVKTLMGFVNKFAIGLTYVGQGAITVATIFVTAWAGIELIVLGVMTAVAAVGTGLVSLVAGLAQLAGEIPGAGKLVDGFAVGASNLALAMDEVTRGLAEQTAAANQALAGNSELQQTLDTMSGAFVTARDAMVAMEGAEALAADAAAPLKKGLDDVGASATLTAAQIKAMEDATRKGQEAMMDAATLTAEQFKTLQDDLTLANLNGTQARLFEIQLAQDEEMAGIQHVAFENQARYEEMTAMVQEKYDLQRQAALGYFSSIEQAAASAGFQTRDQMEQTAANAADLWLSMMASGKFTDAELEKAHKKYTDAVKAMDKDKAMNAGQQFDLIAGAASSLLGSIFGKNKTAAIAAVIIDTAAAVVKTLAAYPFPWSLIPAAAVAAAGLVQLNKIKSTEAGFAMGTPQMSFQDFGRETAVALHGPEAVVTKNQGSNLADMVLGAVSEREDRAAAETRAMREDLRQLHQVMPLWIRDAMQQGAATG